MNRLFRTLLIILVIQVGVAWAAPKGQEHQFRGAFDGGNPQSGLVSDGAGNFYGTTTYGGVANCGQITPYCGTVYKAAFDQNGIWTETVIYKFQGGNDGAEPSSNLIFDSAGNLYGSTVAGGGSFECGNGCGTIFELSPSQNGTWTESFVYAFTGGSGGSRPYSIAFDTAGNLYGAAGVCSPCGGMIFRLMPTQGGWTETVLYTFDSGTSVGPNASLTLDASGNIYGTTIQGGSGCSAHDCGTVFEVSPAQGGSWTETVLYNFHDGLDGTLPDSGVTFDSAGNLYGEAQEGGSLACPVYGCGVIYELSPQPGGWKFSVVHTFNGLNGSKGNQPSGGLVFDHTGNLYGTTQSGGNLNDCFNAGCGTIFRLAPKTGGGFNFSILGEFNGRDGTGPEAGVIVDDAGNLYGTTIDGGDPNCNCGVVFEFTP